jgi:triacylglycerol lipase
MKLSHLKHWATDYLYLAKGHSYPFIYRKPPEHYLGHVVGGKSPIVLIPGVMTKWQFLKPIADPLSHFGHPIYVLEHLGYNTGRIDHSAKLVRELIEEKNLKEVIIIAHSKGGLVGKQVLDVHNEDGRVIKLISVSTPYKGSKIVHFIPLRHLKELSHKSEMVQGLNKEFKNNSKITSIYGIFDNHVWPLSSSNLVGAKNIQVETRGHHKILFDKKIAEIIRAEVKN